MAEQQQLPPTTAIQEDEALRANTEEWYEYPIKVQPHHTDYAGIVWHGSYLTWMEAALCYTVNHQSYTKKHIRIE
ncbi:MAG: hypothetical protein SAJ37_12075 [Oscillatoria sp. PMC 1068.18]|nr:hypothetical protein [Oscillatoria sp. PMC 1076.18]MEC4989479.1 hypothetical protein [Oscillatoria sp. PMC 1068.18]